MSHTSFLELCRFICENDENLYDGHKGIFAKYIPNVLIAITIRHNVSLCIINEENPHLGDKHIKTVHFMNDHRKLYLFQAPGDKTLKDKGPAYYVPLLPLKIPDPGA